MKNSYKFFQNTACIYFPCHQYDDVENFNCLFCYCPLYFLGDQCGGCFEYVGKDQRIKNCTHCVFPHDPVHYDAINSRLKEIIHQGIHDLE